MELYTLDSLLRRKSVIDRYVSLIWTERETSHGDFELIVHSTVETRSFFTTGTRVMINDSNVVMTIETIENKNDSEGKKLLSITGRSLEQILDDRVAMDGMQGLTSNPKWTLTGTPSAIARDIFRKICIDGILSTADKIPFVDPNTLLGYRATAIPEPEDIITVELDPTTVFKAIKDICEAYKLGFRLVRELNENDLAGTPSLRFYIYSGHDRTMLQESLPPVVFSPELDNLSNTTELTSIAQYKNVAYVFAKNGTLVVYAPGVNPNVAGFVRRIAVVKHDGEETGAALTAILQQKGYEELSMNRGISVFDGEIPQTGSYRYGIDYQLGDLVEMRNADGLATNMRVTEQIFVSDSEGERSYPTLAVELAISPGTWGAWDEDQVWAESDTFWKDA